MYSPASRRVRSTRPSGKWIGRWKARDHDITKVAPAFWAIPVLEKTPWAAFLDAAQRKNQIWLRSAEILQWGQEKIHVSFAYHCGRVASAKYSFLRRAVVAARWSRRASRPRRC